MSINQKIISWAKLQVNKRIGDGECWTYVEQAVVKAGGKSSKTLTPSFGPNSDYVWGKVTALTSLQPGDLIQFRDYRWDKKSTVLLTFKDGATWKEPIGGYETRSHHSAIVEKVNADGTVDVLEQNIPKGKGVIRSTLRLSSAKKPKSSKQEMRLHPFNKKMEMATVETTVDETVKGKLWAYRAEK